jgi:hypothetical protein
MSPHLDKELCGKYTNIMVERHLGAMQTSMCWGFDHGDGWFHILDTAMKLVQSHIDITRRRGHEIEQVVFEQVKEKFGMLTIYHRGGDEYTRGILRMAEEISRCTCEECGSPGTPTKTGWIRTLCDKHHEEMGK